ncbi:hypothetical protein [Pseudomonas sessilinigenes]|uniref:Phage tail protein n=1 Tax=Pseudomonas sessilinigenes TaxID=658629 RepID=A0ABX8MXY6_9PSED|nr:hypothetical protein [Pseudomonas sessilinigenes]AZC23226.1 hypothetical protein C4K39_1535 [Pseudomonas sessilinigenes]QXH42241.1 hypothetical protein KSS89_08480 [Pseudomonas sessilinigenes]
MNVGSYARVAASDGVITLQSSPADLQAFQDFAAMVPKAAAVAQRRAINKTLRWLRTYISRGVSSKERIAVGAVRQRLRAYPINSAGQGKLWFGINPIESSRIGRARQNRSGVSVAGRRYQGAFYKQVYGSQADIWIRTGSRHYDPADYPETREGRRRSGFINENDNRFPLAKAKVSLDDVRPIFDEWVKRADQRLLEILEQELNFELQKYLRGSKGV